MTTRMKKSNLLLGHFALRDLDRLLLNAAMEGVFDDGFIS